METFTIQHGETISIKCGEVVIASLPKEAGQFAKLFAQSPALFEYAQKRIEQFSGRKIDNLEEIREYSMLVQLVYGIEGKRH